MDLGLLLVRAVIGALFVGHGTGKLFGWFAGGGVEATAGYFAALRYPRARAMAVLAGVTEAAAGLGFGLGLATPAVAAALVGVMINAAVAHGDRGLWSENEGYEYPLVLAVVAVAVALAGPGDLSIDAVLGLGWHGAAWGAAAAALGAASAGILLATRRAEVGGGSVAAAGPDLSAEVAP